MNQTNRTMSEETKAAKAAKKDGPAKVAVRVKVLAGGLQICGSTAAVGAVLRCYEDVAAFHEKRGEVKILGT